MDNGDYFITFDGANAFVDLGNIQPDGSYTKAAWVKRKYAYNFKHNILSGNSSHAFCIPQSQGARLSAGHQDNFFVVQDSDSIPENIWTFVSVTYDASSGTMTLYKNSEQVDQATGVPLHEESTTTYIGRYGSGKVWCGDIDEVALWNKALSRDEIC